MGLSDGPRVGEPGRVSARSFVQSLGPTPGAYATRLALACAIRLALLNRPYSPFYRFFPYILHLYNLIFPRFPNYFTLPTFSNWAY